jgi:KDO2-lipid IV(A) lauroyltransferase
VKAFKMFFSQKNTYTAILLLFKLLGLIPLKYAYRLSSLLGLVVFWVDKKHRNITIENLSRALGSEKNPKEIRIIAKQVFKNLFSIIFEIAWSLRLDSKDYQKYFWGRGIVNLKTAFEKRKGILVLTAHMGNWELLPITTAVIPFSLNILFRPLDFLPLDQFFIRLRSRFGAKMISTAHSMRKVLRVLQQGEVIAMLMDQNVDWYEGVFVDFFGRRACTNKGLALLARKTEAPVIPVFLIREKKGFIVDIGKEIPLIKTGDKTKDLEANTQQYNKIIEDFIRRYPDQWFWVHQRWKTRPYQPWPQKM